MMRLVIILIVLLLFAAY
ncbi:hypothetical protein ACLK2G_15370 [Escherichia coli]